MLSVIIITKNEAHNIERCLQSVAFAQEIIVVDSGSTDSTAIIAKRFTPYVYTHENWQGYGIQKQRALGYATQPWVLNLDADETVTPQLQQTIIKAISSAEIDGYRIPIAMNFYDKALAYSSSPARHIRLFKREGAQFSTDIVHEKIILPKTAVVKKLTMPLMHHSFQDLSHALYKINRYSSYSAKIRLKTKKPPGLGRVLAGSAWMFLRCYILQKGFLDGRAGVLMAALNAQGTFYRGMKQIYPDKHQDKLPEVIKDN